MMIRSKAFFKRTRRGKVRTPVLYPPSLYPP